MAYSYGEPRYGISANFRSAGEDSGGSKTINYVNLAIGEGSSGYTPEQVNSFIAMIATVTNKTASNIRMTTERPLMEVADEGGGE